APSIMLVLPRMPHGTLPIVNVGGGTRGNVSYEGAVTLDVDPEVIFIEITHTMIRKLE
ncbi:hypothetical protein HAX54_041978, partial [Datura stramonium]|nr:hypothetical protein [Datura stramonium]